MAEISSSSFDPVFDTEKCDIPEIPPISDQPLILDCEIPAPLTPIFDCPDIDLPIDLNNVIILLRAIGGGQGPKGPKGEDGDDGAAGANGSDGCDPEIKVKRTVTCVYDRDLVSVDMVILETEPCVWEISFHFFIYCSDFNPENVCCYWVWCPCGENSIGPPEAEDCGFAADYCDDRPGQWTLITNMSDGECAEQNPPCIKGNYHGQVEVNCYDWCDRTFDCDPCVLLSNAQISVYSSNCDDCPEPDSIDDCSEFSFSGTATYASGNCLNHWSISTSVAAGGDCATTASSTLACDEDGWVITLKYGDSTETRRESDGEVYVDTESLSGFVKVYTCGIPASSFEIIDTETCCGDEAPEVVPCFTVEYTLTSC